MSFENPIWLSIAPLLALVAAGIIALGLGRRNQLLRQFAASRLLERLTEKASIQRTVLKGALISFAFAAIALALARPQYGIEWSQQKARGLDIVFALDSSRSMLATDTRPTRLDRAKLAILDLMDRLESDRIGLVAFAGQAFLQTPPTLDYSAFRESLDATNPSILSRGGSDIGRALEESSKAFPTQNNVKVVVLLTDGEDLGGEAIAAARQAAEDGIQIFTIGIGTPEGAYLRVRNAAGDEEFVRDNSGQPVRSQLDEATLQQIAQSTGGTYSRLSGGTLNALYDSVLATLPREERESELKEVKIERFQWALTAALAFLVFEMLIRRRAVSRQIITTLAIGALFLSPKPTSADDLPAEEPSNFEQAHEAVKAGDFTKAYEQYEQSVRRSPDKTQQRDALYNMGHTQHQLARVSYSGMDLEGALEQIQESEQLFKSVLEIDPNDPTVMEDIELTRRVREAIEKALDQQQQDQQSDQQDQTEENEQQEDKQEQESESGENSEDQNEGQENQEDSSQSDEGQTGDSQESQDSESGSESEDQDSEQENSQDPQESEDEGAEQPSQESDEGNEEESAQSEQEQAESAQDDEESQPVPQVGDEEAPENAEQGESSGQSAQIQRMTLEEAQDLLDSLRGNEEILPFAQPVQGQGRPVQDW